MTENFCAIPALIQRWMVGIRGIWAMPPQHQQFDTALSNVIWVKPSQPVEPVFCNLTQVSGSFAV